MATKLWDKGFEPDKMIEEYTVGNDRELDMRLARYDVQGSLAHIAMLETIGLLTAGELEKLTAGLKEIAAEIEAGRFEIEPGTEDVHSQVELMLTRRLGDAGKKIHSGRSRNDQVLVDLKLFLRDELRQTAEAVKTVFDRLQTLSEQYKEVLMPGYTHLQIAMPSSFGLWFGAYAETLVDDMRLIAAAWHIANQNPLGSAAGYGSSFPLDREMTTRLLGFEALHYNVVAAQMSRGKSERTAANAWPEWPKVLKTDYGQQEAIAVFGSDPRIYQTTVKEFYKNEAGQVCGALIAKLESKVVDEATGRRAMVPTGEEFAIECDLVLIAAGFTGCQPYVAEAFGVDLTKRGTVADTKYATNVPHVFTCGDMRRGQSLVVWALREGRDAAAEVDKSLMGYTNL